MRDKLEGKGTMIDYVKGLFHENRSVQVVSALMLIGICFSAGYYWRGYSEPRFDVPEEWLPAFSGFSSDGERQFFLCDVGMRSLADLSTMLVGTFGFDGKTVPMRLNPMPLDELKAVQARLERTCSMIDRYRR